jgi:hypothetical protein
VPVAPVLSSSSCCLFLPKFREGICAAPVGGECHPRLRLAAHQSLRALPPRQLSSKIGECAPRLTIHRAHAPMHIWPMITESASPASISSSVSLRLMLTLPAKSGPVKPLTSSKPAGPGGWRPGPTRAGQATPGRPRRRAKGASWTSLDVTRIPPGRVAVRRGCSPGGAWPARGPYSPGCSFPFALRLKSLCIRSGISYTKWPELTDTSCHRSEGSRVVGRGTSCRRFRGDQNVEGRNVPRTNHYAEPSNERSEGTVLHISKPSSAVIESAYMRTERRDSLEAGI